MPDAQDTRLGMLAVRAGFISRAELEEVLLEQARRQRRGAAAKLGEIMLDLGYVTRRQLQKLLGRQVAVQARVTRVGPYHLLAKLGEGGMGAVYQARDLRTGDFVALKVLPRSKAKDPNFLSRFEAEARAAFELDHPNIVKGIGLGEAGGYHYIALEYLDGRDVYEILDDRGRIPEHEALSITIQIARALEHAHQKNLVHRDVKPGNILVTWDGVAKLTDFGLALDRERLGRGRITEGAEALGTPFYLSPEQARGDKEVDIGSDIYSLGATLYEMVTGRPPFEGATIAAVLVKHLNEQIPSPRDIDRTLSAGFCHVIEKMMAKRREDRYQTPKDLLRDLLLIYQAKDPISVPVDTGLSTVRPSTRPPRVRSSRTERPGRRSPRVDVSALIAEPEQAGRPGRRREAAGGAGAPADAGARKGPLRVPDRKKARLALIGAGGVILALALGFVLGRRSGRETKVAVSVGRPPALGGQALLTDFETGATQGWSGTVFQGGTGEGLFSLQVPVARPPETGLLARSSRLDFIAGKRIEMAFLYYYDGPGPLAVELFDRDAGVAFQYRFTPEAGRWTAAHFRGEDLADMRGYPGRPGAGHVAGRITVRAPEGSSADALAIDSFWLHSDWKAGPALPDPASDSVRVPVLGVWVDVGRSDSAGSQMELAASQADPRRRAACYQAVPVFFPLEEAASLKALLRLGRTYLELLKAPAEAAGVLAEALKAAGSRAVSIEGRSSRRASRADIAEILFWLARAEEAAGKRPSALARYKHLLAPEFEGTKEQEEARRAIKEPRTGTPAK